jgi:hypothetical protein
LKVECPTGSGDEMNLANVADEIQHRIIHIFARDHEGVRACNGGSEKLNKDPHFRDHVLFHGELAFTWTRSWTCLIIYLFITIRILPRRQR